MGFVWKRKFAGSRINVRGGRGLASQHGGRNLGELRWAHLHYPPIILSLQVLLPENTFTILLTVYTSQRPRRSWVSAIGSWIFACYTLGARPEWGGVERPRHCSSGLRLRPRRDPGFITGPGPEVGDPPGEPQRIKQLVKRSSCTRAPPSAVTSCRVWALTVTSGLGGAGPCGAGAGSDLWPPFASFHVVTSLWLDCPAPAGANSRFDP